ncbi:MAG: MCP four helix bundle domain-containing protein [Bacteroidia bacterium]
MKWIYSRKQKLIIAVTLIVVLAMAVWSNLSERNKLEKLNHSFVSIYEDRLLVESYIYKLSELLHKKEAIINSNSGNSRSTKKELHKLDNEINDLIAQYEVTFLTTAEAIYFQRLKDILDDGKKAESNGGSLRAEEQKKIRSSLLILSKLSDIQVAEGARIKDESKKLMLGSAVSSQFDMALLIIIGLALQGLLLASQSLKDKFDQNYNLN